MTKKKSLDLSAAGATTKKSWTCLKLQILQRMVVDFNWLQLHRLTVTWQWLQLVTIVVTTCWNQLDTGHRLILSYFSSKRRKNMNQIRAGCPGRAQDAHQDQSWPRNPRNALRWWPWWQWWHQSLTLVQTIGCFRQGHPFRKPCGVVLRKQSAGNHTCYDLFSMKPWAFPLQKAACQPQARTT